MNTRFIIIYVLVLLCVTGCASTLKSGTRHNSLPSLSPKLSSAVAVAVRDNRPLVEKEKDPSTEYLYSGALFSVDGNEKTVATDLSTLIMQYEGASKAYATPEIPTQGPAVLFEMNHWYSRAPLQTDKSVIVVTGEFAGVITLYRDGKIIATFTTSANGDSGVVDTLAIGKKEISKLIWNAMLNTANSAQQNGYTKLHSQLLGHWHVFVE